MSDERPTFGSLFAGIGGIDLGLERAGWRGRWQVEYEPFCQRVLAAHWPDVTRYGDIHDVDWSGVERVDLVAGGVPCQPFSVAGKQRRLADDRWLWPEFERCVRALRPRYVLVENVPGLLVGGGMDAVLGGLADLGYDTEWESIPAAAVGAPHLRYRVWIVARDDRRNGRASGPGETEAWPAGHAVDGGAPDSTIIVPSNTIGGELRNEPIPVGGSRRSSVARDDGAARLVAYADSGRRESERSGGLLDGLGSAFGDDSDGRGSPVADSTSDGWESWREGDTAQESGGRQPHRSRVGATVADPNGAGPQGRSVQPERSDQRSLGQGGMGNADSASPDAYTEASGPRRGLGESGWWSVEPDVGRVAHGVPARVDRLRALGNAVVPQVVEFIGRRILEAEGLT